jgi:dTMP kinase
MQGQFITVEGIEGAGKSSLVAALTDNLQARGLPLVVTREPGGTEIAERIRAILLADGEETMAPDTELLLLYAARAQHLQQVILPALTQGTWVVCDRFTDATFAYQGGGREVPHTRIAALDDWVTQGFAPDLTFLLDLPVKTAFSRIADRPHDRIEQMGGAFFERIRAAYLARADLFPARFVVIDAAQPMESVLDTVRTALTEHLIKDADAL